MKSIVELALEDLGILESEITLEPVDIPDFEGIDVPEDFDLDVEMDID